MQSLLEHTTLRTVTERTEIWYDPIQPADCEGPVTLVEEDDDFGARAQQPPALSPLRGVEHSPLSPLFSVG